MGLILFHKRRSLSLMLNNNPFNKVLWGVILNMIGHIADILLANNLFITVFGILGWYYIIIGLLYIKNFVMPFKGVYKSLFILYNIVVLIMICRGYIIEYQYPWISIFGAINYHLFAPYYILCYLVPFIVLIPKRYLSLEIIVKVATWIGIAGIIVAVVYSKRIMLIAAMNLLGDTVNDGQITNTTNFAIYTPFAFIALCYKYISFKQWKWNIVGLIVSLMVVSIGGRRGTSAILVVLLLLSLYFYMQSQTRKIKHIYFLLLIILLIGGIYFFFNSSLFEFIRERGFEDNRSHVDQALLTQMNGFELFFGKGLNGRYYFPLIQDDYLQGWRYGSETGFFNYVLKGGYLMMGLYILLLLIPAYNGLVKSKNMLSRIGGVYILLSLIELYPFGHFLFNIKYCIIWMMVSICMSKRFLNMTDTEIKKTLF